MMMSYFFGTNRFAMYPYASVDYLYLENSSLKERGVDSLNLEVNSYSGST